MKWEGGIISKHQYLSLKAEDVGFTEQITSINSSGWART